MAYQSLYRTYRPKTFEQVKGQTHIVNTLKNAIKQQKWSHAYLFCGPRGTGKTTLAKIFARAINCQNPNEAPCMHCPQCQMTQQENHPDIIEMDAASNNSVDDIRDLVEKVKYAPMSAKYKVYIIDEVHMLSTGAFNALLKTLEEAPDHVVFILATTEIHKVIKTIISRCQRFDFNTLSEENIISQLEEVLTQEKISYEAKALQLIAYLAQGGLRDALTMLEQVIAYKNNDITLKDVQQIVRLVDNDTKVQLLEAILVPDIQKSLTIINQLQQSSIDKRQLMLDLIDMSKETLIYQLTQQQSSLFNLYEKEIKQLTQHSQQMLQQLVEQLVTILKEGQYNGEYLNYLEILAIKAAISEKETVVVSNAENNTPTPSVISNAENNIPTPSLKKPAPVKSAPKIKTTTQPTAKPLVAGDSIRDYKPITVNDILGFMVIGDKEERVNDQKKWEQKEIHLIDPKYMPIADLVRNLEISISNHQHILFMHEQVYPVEQLLSKQIYPLFCEFVALILTSQKNILITTQETYQQALQLFKLQRTQNTLIQPKDVVLPILGNQTPQETNPDPLTKIQQVFADVIVK